MEIAPLIAKLAKMAREALGSLEALPSPVWGEMAALAVLVALALGLVGLWRLARDIGRGGLVKNWPAWERLIQEALLTHGEVGLERLPQIPARLRIRALKVYLETHQDEDLVFEMNPPRIRLANPARVEGFLRSLRTAQIGAAFLQPMVERMASQLCDILGFTLLSSRYYRELHGFVVSAPSMRLKLPSRFPLVFLQREEYDQTILRALRDLLDMLNMTSYFALLISLDGEAQGETLKDLVRETVHDFIVLGYGEIKKLLLAQNPTTVLTAIILKQVDLSAVSPYVVSGPVPDNMFFGREQELKTIIRNIAEQNFAVVGGRKIGKTSVLTKLQRLFSQIPEFSPWYLDCQFVSDYETFFEAIATIWDAQPAYYSPENFRRLILQLKQEQEPRSLVILLDEIDALLTYDALHYDNLVRVFHALSQEGHCHFVLSGEKSLNSSLHDASSPLFNFCQPILLGHLRPREVRRIILEPMLEMGIALERPGELVDGIVALSSCHPNIVQYLCQALLALLGQRRERAITLDDLARVERKGEFWDFFLEVVWGGATPLEKIISLVALNRGRVTQSELAAALSSGGLEISPKEFEKALEGLVLCALFRKEGPTYTYATESFPRIVKRSQDVEALLGSLLEQLRLEEESGGMGRHR